MIFFTTHGPGHIGDGWDGLGVTTLELMNDDS
jgi:hypothetical protein